MCSLARAVIPSLKFLLLYNDRTVRPDRAYVAGIGESVSVDSQRYLGTAQERRGRVGRSWGQAARG